MRPRPGGPRRVTLRVIDALPADEAHALAASRYASIRQPSYFSS
jgi:hypothetical protein